MGLPAVQAQGAPLPLRAPSALRVYLSLSRVEKSQQLAKQLNLCKVYSEMLTHSLKLNYSRAHMAARAS